MKEGIETIKRFINENDWPVIFKFYDENKDPDVLQYMIENYGVVYGG